MSLFTKFFIGIDVSKPYFDGSLMAVIDHKKQAVQTARFDNSAEGIKAFEKWLTTHEVTFDENTLVVIENTGVYHRGKNDKIDSMRLCSYAQKHCDELKATPALDPVLMLLKDLMTARTKLVSQVNSIKTYIKELKNANDKAVEQLMQQAHKTAIEGLAKSIKSTEAEISRIITENASLQTNYNLLLSVPGIGHLTAVYLVCCTNNFYAKISGKQLACYAGVVPFEHSSGISVKGKTRLHKMANKELKKMLHLSSLTVIRYYPEFKTYYDRKKQQGKHSMSILNAIGNKIVLRAVTVVNNQKPYVDKTKIAA